jgi:hypothetical protein
MTRKQSPAERLAATRRDDLLADVVARAERTSSWDRFIVEHAVFCHGLANNEFSANDLRLVLPDLAHGYLGAVINSLRCSGVIEHTGRYVPSTEPSTHGHRIALWTLSDKGRAIAASRRAAIRQPERAA